MKLILVNKEIYLHMPHLCEHAALQLYPHLNSEENSTEMKTLYTYMK